MRRVRIVLLIALLLSLDSFSVHHVSAAADIAVVVHRDVPIDNLTFSELRKIVLGDRQFWSSNLRVTLLIRAPAARERDVVLKNVVQMSESQFRQYWIGKVFRAESAAGPKTVYSNEMSISLINSIPGAVAFIDASQVPKDSKIVRLSGLLPGEKGYPLN